MPASSLSTFTLLLFRSIAALMVWFPGLYLFGTRLFGSLLMRLARLRRSIAVRNIELCFKDKSAVERQQILTQHFELLARSFFDHFWLWHGPERLLEDWIEVEGQVPATQTLFICPHLLGMDVAWTQVSRSKSQVAGYYRPPSSKFLDRWFYQQRLRWGSPLLIRKQDGIRSLVRAIQAGQSIFILPDQDMGVDSCEFVPFFGHLASTVTSVPRLAGVRPMSIVFVLALVNDNAPGYRVKFVPALEGVPSGDVLADLGRMNQVIEEVVKQHPSQYYWTHRRFKTRPPGEPAIYPF